MPPSTASETLAATPLRDACCCYALGSAALRQSSHLRTFGGCVAEELREFLAGPLDPGVFGQSVGPECLEITFLRIVKECAMQPEHAGFGVVDQTRRIVGA